MDLLLGLLALVLVLAVTIPFVRRMQVICVYPSPLWTINLIDGACQLYWNDFDEQYPLSDPKTNGTGLEGRYNVVQAVLGYQTDGNGEIDDGLAGPGIRVDPKGRTYGPYNECEKLELVRNEADRSSAFADAFGNPIYYYRWDEKNQTYHDDHNNASPGSDPPDDINRYAAGKSAGPVLRKDFILLSRGRDGQWQCFQDDPDTDDITNFLDED